MIALRRLWCRRLATVILIALVAGPARVWAAEGDSVPAAGMTAEMVRDDGLEHANWSQPPVERDPRSAQRLYCGWGEPAYATRALPYAAAAWTFVADDFRCPDGIPVASLQWWGSYLGWNGDKAPHAAPQSWRIGFWSNAPADERYPFPRPDKLLWMVYASAGRVQEERAGTAGFRQMPPDTVFRYFLEMQPQEYFRPDQFPKTDTEGGLFWLSITAVYCGAPEPPNPWGWQSRPRPWAGGAVTTRFKRDELRAGFALDPSTVRPTRSLLACEQETPYDMAFELATAPGHVQWEQQFTGIRGWAGYQDEQSVAVEDGGGVVKWTQPPGLTTAGADVDMTWDSPVTWPGTMAADDFECRAPGPITGITLWASWYRDLLPADRADNVTFTLSIRQNLPAEPGMTGGGRPGKVLWRRQFPRGRFTVEPVGRDLAWAGSSAPAASCAHGYYSPANSSYERDNHVAVYQYTFPIDPHGAFEQSGTEKDPAVYWLAVQARVVHAPGHMATRLGWQTATPCGNAAAVWVRAEEPYDDTAWQPLAYPKGHPFGGKPIDLAFTVETQSSPAGTVLRRMVADDWWSRDDRPMTGVAWWGSYPGSGYLPCECVAGPGSARPEWTSPQPPDYFLLSIWTDGPGRDRGGDSSSSPASWAGTGACPYGVFHHPDRKLWEYRADMFDEVLVGFDKAPSPTSSIVQGFEPVYRYAISLPPDRWFRPDGQDTVYWLSIVAVYKDAGSMTYPWGWTNHPLVSRDQQIPSPAGSKPDGAAGPVATGDADCNEGAVAARPSAGDTGDARDWTPLLDPTGRTEDLSFVLFAEPAETADSGYFIGTDPNDGSVEIVIPPSWWP